eukprot:COSAG02_NODE_432_length_22440_cov_53.821315_11_plen_48_part_00
MSTREPQVHVLLCVLFGGSRVTMLVLVVWFTCTFLLSLDSGSCVRFR